MLKAKQKKKNKKQNNITKTILTEHFYNDTDTENSSSIFLFLFRINVFLFFLYIKNKIGIKKTNPYIFKHIMQLLNIY